MTIGIGLADSCHQFGEVYNVLNESYLKHWRDVLRFTFTGDFVRKFFPYDNHFKGMTNLDGARCFYIHDYHPVAGKKLTTEQKKVTNLVFRFKEGKANALVAKLFSLAIERMPFYKEADDPIIIPIPASTT